MSLKKYTFAFSGAVILFGLYAVFQIYTGRANLGIDLAGGTSLQVRFEQPLQMEQVREVLKTGGFSEASLQSVPEENIFIIKVSGKRKEEEKMVGEKVLALLREGFPSNPQTMESVAEIGPAIGKKLRTDALFALAVSAVAIILYLAWRFEFKFGVAATLATFHDVIMLVGIFYLLGREMDRGVFAHRHRRRLRSDPGKHPPPQEKHLLGDDQPQRERGAEPHRDHFGHHVHGVLGAPCVRRRRPEGFLPRPGARHHHRDLFLRLRGQPDRGDVARREDGPGEKVTRKVGGASRRKVVAP
jgi:hypothetical protein